MSDDESAAVSEGELAMRKRREQQAGDSAGLEEADKELLENNRVERSRMDDEIRELRERNEKRKKEREIEEKRLASERAAEDQRRKAEEEERKRKKTEEEDRKKKDRAVKMAEFEKYKNPPKANFVISKRAATEEGAEGEDDGKSKKSKEQLEAEKQAILRQRLKPLDIDSADNAKLTEKAKELHTLLARLEGEKYDLEKRYKNMQQEMMSLAERARQANKVGKEGTVKRLNDDTDRMMERFAGAPSKVEMYSKYERQKDKRTYDDRKVLFTGPMRVGPPEKISPHRIVKWTEEGLPEYGDMGAGGAPAPQEAAA